MESQFAIELPTQETSRGSGSHLLRSFNHKEVRLRRGLSDLFRSGIRLRIPPGLGLFYGRKLDNHESFRRPFAFKYFKLSPAYDISAPKFRGRRSSCPFVLLIVLRIMNVDICNDITRHVFLRS